MRKQKLVSEQEQRGTAGITRNESELKQEIATQTSPRNTVDPQRFEELELQVRKMSETLAALLETSKASSPSQQATSHRTASTSKNGTKGLRPDTEQRIEFLEEMEAKHSKLITLKAKADTELYQDIENMKESIKVLEGKVEYCVQTLDDTESESPGDSEHDGQDTERFDNDIEEADVTVGVSD